MADRFDLPAQLAGTRTPSAPTGAQIQRPHQRPDRLVAVRCDWPAEIAVTCAAQRGGPWRPATVYPGLSSDAWRSTSRAAWEAAAVGGRLPAHVGAFVWNPCFDVLAVTRAAWLRLVEAPSGALLHEQEVDLSACPSPALIDATNAAHLAGGALPGSWRLAPGAVKIGAADSLFLEVRSRTLHVPAGHDWHEVLNADEEPLILRPAVCGWHRIYVGTDTGASCRFSLVSKDGEEDAEYTVATLNHAEPGMDRSRQMRPLQDFYVCSADLSGQAIVLRPGGPLWPSVWIRYVRLVPMTDGEVDDYRRARTLAQTRGRPFAGYLEQYTAAYYLPPAFTLRANARNEMRLNRARGSTGVYAHVIRIGCKAWYHSTVVEQFRPARKEVGADVGAYHFSLWMDQGDPLAVAVAEAHANGLELYADAGMNSTYCQCPPDSHYGRLSERFARAHPELLCAGNRAVFDYRKPQVRDYVVAVVNELLTRYDTDGVHLDFARWGHREAYDLPSLLDTLRRIHACRQRAQAQRGRELGIAVRVPYDPPQTSPGLPAAEAGGGAAPRPAGQPTGEPPAFLAAVGAWAREGLVDRASVCLVDGRDWVAEAPSLARYVEAARGTATELWLDMYQGTWYMPVGGPQHDLALARQHAASGVAGGVFYYMEGRLAEWGDINWQMRLLDFPETIVDPHHVRPASTG